MFTNLYSFTGSTDGAFPLGGLVEGSDGSLYGVTELGGIGSWFNGYGTAFQITNGAFNLLYQFENAGDGANPNFVSLVEGLDGLFYGTTEGGGADYDGTVFVLTPDGFELPIYSFSQLASDGAGPYAGLALGKDGNFYGTTLVGGRYGCGTLFRITPDWDYTNLFSFNGTNGAVPYSALVGARDGSLYGTTAKGGTSYHGFDSSGPTGYGSLFRITTAGTFTSLFSFSNTNGAQPMAGLTQSDDGNLYGTTELGGAKGYGTVFKLTTNGVFSLILSFDGTAKGGYPIGRLLQASDGNLYGTTADVAAYGGGDMVGNGTVFRLTPTGAYTKVYSFTGFAGGVEPVAGLIQARDGNFYGTCMGGNSFGMVFRLSVPLAPVVRLAPTNSGRFNLVWSAVSGQTYQPQYRTNLSTDSWRDLGSPLTATNGLMSRSDSTSADAKRFYRVVLLP